MRRAARLETYQPRVRPELRYLDLLWICCRLSCRRCSKPVPLYIYCVFHLVDSIIVVSSVHYATDAQQIAIKTAIDRRLRPRCCHLESYFKRPKSSPVIPVRSLACNRYYCAQFTAKPKVACAPRFSWAATSSNLGL